MDNFLESFSREFSYSQQLCLIFYLVAWTKVCSSMIPGELNLWGYSPRLCRNCMSKIQIWNWVYASHSMPPTQSTLPTLVKRLRKVRTTMKCWDQEQVQRWTRSQSPWSRFHTYLCKWTSLELLCRTVWIYKIMSLPLLRGCAEEASALWWHEELLAEG